MENTYQIQMYVNKELPIEVRKNFCLPADPYEGDDSAIEYLKTLGVVFYRDEEHQNGIIIQPDDGNETPISERGGWLGYKSSCVIDEDELSISGWDAPTEEYVKKKGDDRAWLEFNKPVTVTQMDHGKVAVA